MVSTSTDADISGNKVMVFSKSYCPFAKQAKDLLKSGNVDAKIIELDQVSNGADIQNYLKTKSGQSTVPNIFIDGKHIGGCSETKALHSAGKLKTTLDAAGVSHSY